MVRVGVDHVTGTLAGVCYSGYRREHHPERGLHPTRDQVRQDLHLLVPHWRHLRLYSAGPLAAHVLEVIDTERLAVQVLLGAWLTADEAETARELDRVVAFARRYPHIVTAVAAGNEHTAPWSAHALSVERLVACVRTLQAALDQPVTACEHHTAWTSTLAPLAAAVDFLSLHSYPLWDGCTVENAALNTAEHYQRVVSRFPDKPIFITEAGWPTRSNGGQIARANASVTHQRRYLHDLSRWNESRGIRVYVFEAFDEPWKGSADPDDPEKFWGLFNVDRLPKV